MNTENLKSGFPHLKAPKNDTLEPFVSSASQRSLRPRPFWSALDFGKLDSQASELFQKLTRFEEVCASLSKYWANKRHAYVSDDLNWIRAVDAKHLPALTKSAHALISLSSPYMQGLKNLASSLGQRDSYTAALTALFCNGDNLFATWHKLSRIITLGREKYKIWDEHVAGTPTLRRLFRTPESWMDFFLAKHYGLASVPIIKNRLLVMHHYGFQAAFTDTVVKRGFRQDLLCCFSAEKGADREAALSLYDMGVTLDDVLVIFARKKDSTPPVPISLGAWIRTACARSLWIDEDSVSSGEEESKETSFSNGDPILLDSSDEEEEPPKKKRRIMISTEGEPKATQRKAK